MFLHMTLTTDIVKNIDDMSLVHTSFDYLWEVFGVLYSWQYFRLTSTPLTSSHSGRKNGDLLLHSGVLVVKNVFANLGPIYKKNNKICQRTSAANGTVYAKTNTTST